MKYSNEQLIRLNDNLVMVNIKANDVLKVIQSNPDIKYKDIFSQISISKFVVDKVIAAFVGCGLVGIRNDGTNKYYKITEDGKNFLKINNKGEGR